MPTVTMTMEEYLQLISGLTSDMPGMMELPGNNQVIDEVKPKPKKKTAYQRRYQRNFRKIENDYKLKSGKWKKNGFKMAVKMAHKMSKK